MIRIRSENLIDVFLENLLILRNLDRLDFFHNLEQVVEFGIFLQLFWMVYGRSKYAFEEQISIFLNVLRLILEF